MEHFLNIAIQRDPPISASEWIAAASEAGLELIDHVPGRNPRTGELLIITAPYTGQFDEGPEGGLWHFRFGNGQITVDWADDRCVQKAGEVTLLLGGRMNLMRAD